MSCVWNVLDAAGGIFADQTLLHDPAVTDSRNRKTCLLGYKLELTVSLCSRMLVSFFVQAEPCASSSARLDFHQGMFFAEYLQAQNDNANMQQLTKH